MHQRRWLELMKENDLTIHYPPGKSNIVVDALSQKFEGSLAALLTQQSSLLKKMEMMQIEVQVMMMIIRINQVNIKFDLYDKIKESNRRIITQPGILKRHKRE